MPLMTRGSDAAPSDELGLPEIVPYLLGVERVLSDDDLREVVQYGGAYLLRALHAAGEADAADALVGLDAHHVETGGGIDVHPVADGLVAQPAVGFHSEGGYLHVSFLSWLCGLGRPGVNDSV